MRRAERHGKIPGEEVAHIAEQSFEAVQGDLGTANESVELHLQELPKSEIGGHARLSSGEVVTAHQMLRALVPEKTLPKEYGPPVAGWGFAGALTSVALIANTEAEYVDLIEAVLLDCERWRAGYKSDCFGYLPTEQLVMEARHENIGFTLWLWVRNLRWHAGFFASSVEQVIVRTEAHTVR